MVSKLQYLGLFVPFFLFLGWFIASRHYDSVKPWLDRWVAVRTIFFVIVLLSLGYTALRLGAIGTIATIFLLVFAGVLIAVRRPVKTIKTDEPHENRRKRQD